MVWACCEQTFTGFFGRAIKLVFQDCLTRTRVLCGLEFIAKPAKLFVTDRVSLSDAVDAMMLPRSSPTPSQKKAGHDEIFVRRSTQRVQAYHGQPVESAVPDTRHTHKARCHADPRLGLVPDCFLMGLIDCRIRNQRTCSHIPHSRCVHHAGRLRHGRNQSALFQTQATATFRCPWQGQRGRA